MMPWQSTFVSAFTHTFAVTGAASELRNVTLALVGAASAAVLEQRGKG